MSSQTITPDAFLATVDMLTRAGLVPPESMGDEEGIVKSHIVWAWLWEGYTDQHLARAVQAFIATGPRFWPTPIGLLHFVKKTATGEQAWDRLVTLMRLHGRDYPPLKPGKEPAPRPDERNESAVRKWEDRQGHLFRLDDDPDTEAAMYQALLAIGGWRALAGYTAYELRQDRPFFIASFNSARGEQQRDRLHEIGQRRLANGMSEIPRLTDQSR